jgi:hypothetical protein
MTKRSETSIFDLAPILREYMTTSQAAERLGIGAELARLIILSSGQEVRAYASTLLIRRDWIERFAETREHMREEDKKYVRENNAKHWPRHNYKDVLARMNSDGAIPFKSKGMRPRRSRIDISDLLEQTESQERT